MKPLAVHPIGTMRLDENHVESQFQFLLMHLASSLAVPTYTDQSNCYTPTASLAVHFIDTTQLGEDHDKSTFQVLLRRLASFSAVSTPISLLNRQPPAWHFISSVRPNW